METAEELAVVIWTEMFRLYTESKPQFCGQKAGYVKIAHENA
jgi:hypothetical protein